MKELRQLQKLLQQEGSPEALELIAAADEKLTRALEFLYSQESGVASIVLRILDPAKEAKPPEPETEPDFYHIYGKPAGGIKRKIGHCIEDNLNHEQERLKKEIEEADTDGRKWQVWAEIKRKNGKIVG